MVNSLKDHEIPRNIYTVGLHISWTEKDQETVNSFLPILLSVWLLNRCVSLRETTAPHPWILWVWSPLVIMNVCYIYNHRFQPWEDRVRHISVLETTSYQYLINCTIHLQIVNTFVVFCRFEFHWTLRWDQVPSRAQCSTRNCSSSWIMMFCCFGVKVLRVHFTFWSG